MRKLIFLLLTAILAATATAQNVIRVACIGNSITQGARVENPETNAYPAVLGVLLGDRYEVENFGVSGRTMLKNGDRPYWKEQAFEDAKAYQPDIVTIKLGTNDSKPVNWDTHAVEFEGDLRDMIHTFQTLESNPRIYLCFPVWANTLDVKPPFSPTQIRQEIIAGQIIPIIQKIADETGVGIIDLQTTLYGQPQLLPDRIHPNALGQSLIAKTIYDRIK
jgi:lysophospholipase L1-like esterase